MVFSSLRTKRVLLDELNPFVSLENLTQASRDDFLLLSYQGNRNQLD